VTAQSSTFITTTYLHNFDILTFHHLHHRRKHHDSLLIVSIISAFSFDHGSSFCVQVMRIESLHLTRV